VVASNNAIHKLDRYGIKWGNKLQKKYSKTKGKEISKGI
jgi:hypothetical protein